MADLHHIEQAIEAAAEAVVVDTVAYVKAHPDYQRVIEALGAKAIQAIAAGL